LRADLSVPEVREFVARFGATAVLHKVGGRGTLRQAATAAGIPAVAFELGEPGTLQIDDVEYAVKAIDTLIDKLDMVTRFSLWSEPQPIYYQSRWLRSYRGGILMATIDVGVRVQEGELLGVVTNPVTNEHTEIRAPFQGRLLGRALNQFVLPGFATFHLGIETQDATKPAAAAIVDPVDTEDETGDDGEFIEETATAVPGVGEIDEESH
jgi:predicted deacylase